MVVSMKSRRAGPPDGVVYGPRAGSVTEGESVSSIVYQTDRRSGTTYAYRSTSYRDPQSGRPKARREYLGRVDPATGEIVPKAGPGRRNRSPLGDASGQPDAPASPAGLARALAESREEAARLRAEVEDLRARLSSLLDAADALARAADGARGGRDAGDNIRGAGAKTTGGG